MNSIERVVVVTIDALRADHLPIYGYERDTAPFLADLATQSTVFTESYSVSSHTRESMPSLLSGRYPDEVLTSGYWFNGESLPEYLTVPSAMFHSNPFLSRAYGFDRGFDTFDDDLALGRNRLYALIKRAFDKLTNRHYVRGQAINERSLSWIDGLDGDEFLLWNHYMDVHGPYQPPERYQLLFRDATVSKRRSQYLLQKSIRRPDRLTDSERSTLLDLYDAEIRYIDDCLKSFVDSLRRAGLWEGTLFILTSDHGEAFGEEGHYEHPRELFEGLVHVPLIVHGPGWKPMGVSVPTSSLDLAPTIVQAFGADSTSFPGTDLRSIAEHPTDFEDRVIISQVSKRRSKQVEFRARGAESEAMAIVDGETYRIDGTDPALQRLRTHVTDRDPMGDLTDPADQNGDIARRLRALGYLEDE